VQGRYHGDALQAALSRGHAEVVGLLLDKGADVNAQGGHYGNALRAASDGYHADVVRLLLHKGADLKAQAGFYDNALYAVAAFYCGHAETVTVPPDKSADVNAL
jgi:ankyrin repeat protein